LTSSWFRERSVCAFDGPSAVGRTFGNCDSSEVRIRPHVERSHHGRRPSRPTIHTRTSWSTAWVPSATRSAITGSRRRPKCEPRRSGAWSMPIRAIYCMTAERIRSRVRCSSTRDKARPQLRHSIALSSTDSQDLVDFLNSIEKGDLGSAVKRPPVGASSHGPRAPRGTLGKRESLSRARDCSGWPRNLTLEPSRDRPSCVTFERGVLPALTLLLTEAREGRFAR